MDVFSLFKNYIDESCFIIIPFLYGIGIPLRINKKISSSYIPVILEIISIIATTFILLNKNIPSRFIHIVIFIITVIGQATLCTLSSMGIFSYLKNKSIIIGNNGYDKNHNKERDK